MENLSLHLNHPNQAQHANWSPRIILQRRLSIRVSPPPETISVAITQQYRNSNKTPDWIPLDAVRLSAKPNWNRGRKESVKSVDNLHQLGLVDHPSTYRENQKSKQALEIWDKEERIAQWIISNSPDTEIHRVAPAKEGSSPDFIVGGITIDGKTVNPKKIEQRVSDGSYQAQAVVVDLRGKSAPHDGVKKGLKSAVRNHGDRLDMIVVIIDDETYFWEGAKS